MIRLLFLLPESPVTKSDIQRVITSYRSDDTIEYRYIPTVFNTLAAGLPDWPCDAVIARGYTASTLSSQNLNIPVIKIPFYSSELIDTIADCCYRLHPNRIGIVGDPTLTSIATAVQQISAVSIRIYTHTDSEAALAQSISLALADHCDLIVGGGSSYRYCIAHGIPTQMVAPSFDAIWRSVDSAVNTITVQRQEQAANFLLQSVLDNSSDGLVLLSPAGETVLYNQSAADMLRLSANPALPLSRLIPDLEPPIAAAISSGTNTRNLIFYLNERGISSAICPLEIAGKRDILITLRDIVQVQETERQIRNKLFAKRTSSNYTFHDITRSSAVMERLITSAKKYAQVDSSILITGETGTGKELIAQSIHAASNRSNHAFVAINCATLSESLLESELFGYAPGAFTGAAKEGKIGLFEYAHNGTLFLDEVSELPLSFQSKLLRVLQEREIRRVGDTKVISVDVRIIAATNRNIPQMIAGDAFRKDLYYRLNVLQLSLPALQDRQEDIPPLFSSFVSTYANRFKKKIRPLGAADTQVLLQHSWPGNIRELRNVAERYVVLYDGQEDPAQLLRQCILDIPQFPAPLSGPAAPPPALLLTERDRLEYVLRQHHSMTGAARLLGISRATLYRKMNKYGLGPHGGTAGKTEAPGE